MRVGIGFQRVARRSNNPSGEACRGIGRRNYCLQRAYLLRRRMGPCVDLIIQCPNQVENTMKPKLILTFAILAMLSVITIPVVKTHSQAMSDQLSSNGALTLVQKLSTIEA